ncbi:MAG: PepSY domain-containing protein [Pseudomonadota bacterium]
MKPLPTALTIAITLGIFCIPFAAQSGEQDLLASPLTFDKAIEVALEEQPGTVAEIGLERANGEVVIEIEVVTNTGEEIEFHLDPVTGDILAKWIDTDPTDDPTEGNDAVGEE